METAVGRDVALAILALAIVGFIVWRVRRSSSERDAETSAPDDTVA